MNEIERMGHIRDMYIYSSIPVLFILVALGIWVYKRKGSKRTNEHK